MRYISYQERLKLLNISSLELRRLHSDLIWCFKIVFGYVDVHYDDYFEFHCESATRGYSFKLHKRHFSVNSRSIFLTSAL